MTPLRRAGARLLSPLAAVILAGTLIVPGRAQDPELLTSSADPVRLAAAVTALEQGQDYVPGEMLVRFRTGTGATQRLSALSSIRFSSTLDESRWLGDTLLVTHLPSADMEQAAFVLAAQPEVEWAQPNYIRRLHSAPNDTLFSKQWNMEQINMPAAWDINVSAGSGVTVAVLDSGWTNDEATYGFRIPIALNRYNIFSVPLSRPPDFDYSRVLPGAEFTFTGPWVNSSGKKIVFDTVGHGTHVAGTVAQQTGNALGFAGVANGATLMPVKVCEGSMDWILSWGRDLRLPPTLSSACITSDVIDGIRYAVDNGAKVLNLSLGGPGAEPAYLDALRYAVSRGAFVSLSAGNEGDDGNPTNYPAAYAASVPGVVAVAATSNRRTRARYSSFGSYVELAAPGGDCESDDDSIWQVGPDDADLNALPPRFDKYFQEDKCGTSMASPHVAGAAALLYSQGITDPAAIEAALERFAVDLGTKGKDPEFGYGLIDVRAALRGLGLAK